MTELILLSFAGVFCLIVLASQLYMQWRLKKVAELLDSMAQRLKEASK